MRKIFVSAVALGAAIGFAMPAAAQSEIGGNVVSPEELPFVQAYCDELQIDVDTPTSPAADPEEDAGLDASDADVLADDPEGVSEAVTTFDLSTITYEDCVAAGLVGDAGFETLPADPAPIDDAAPANGAAIDEAPTSPAADDMTDDD